MDFTSSSIDLSLRNAETGRPLTATVYDVTLDNGTMRTMSVAQLVMAICLKRATEKEADVVAIMEDMARVTANIEVVSDIEARLLELDTGESINSVTGSWVVVWVDDDGTVHENTYTTAQAALNRMGIVANTSLTIDAIIDNIESKLDELNTMSQEQMIMLQSETNKRDQAYEMISNILKSLYTVLTGVANNV